MNEKKTYKVHLQYNEKERKVKNIFDLLHFSTHSKILQNHATHVTHVTHVKLLWTHATHTKMLWTHATKATDANRRYLADSLVGYQLISS